MSFTEWVILGVVLGCVIGALLKILVKKRTANLWLRINKCR